MSRDISIGIPEVIEVASHRLVGGALTEGGVQWSSEVSTVTANTDHEVLKLTLDDGEHVGRLNMLEFNLTLALRAGSVTADVRYKWQARNRDAATWVDLHDYITKVDIGITYLEYTVSGYRLIRVTNLDVYPFEIRLVIQSNEAAPGVATARVKNSSHVKVEMN